MTKDYLSTTLSNCTLCPRNCGVNRIAGEQGICRSGVLPKASRAALHYWEEPCLSGTRGSGTVFFSGCSLHCSFCQNQKISQGEVGKELTPSDLAVIYLNLQAQGAHNINLVTPMHLSIPLIESLRIAKNKGLTLPIIVNTGGYEKVAALKLWEGIVDIYLPDVKFYSSKVSDKFVAARDYFEVAQAALQEMFRQVGEPLITGDGLMKKGMLVRHLMIPGYLFDSRHILEYLCDTYGDKIYLSLMNQYTPPQSFQHQGQWSVSAQLAPDHPLRQDHYDALIDYLCQRGMESVYIQEQGTCEESFIPPFDLTGLDIKKPS